MKRVDKDNKADNNKDSSDYKGLMEKLTYVKPGRKFTREEMNERHTEKHIRASDS